MNIMDLANLALSQESFLVEIKHPIDGTVITDDAGVPFSISVLSSDTNEFKMAWDEVKRDARKKLSAGGELTKDEKSQSVANALAKTTTACNLVFNKKKVEHSVAAIAAILVNPEYNWLKDQVTVAMDNRSNFIKG